eukprot:1936399-Prymnesium_polylepis.1
MRGRGPASKGWRTSESPVEPGRWPGSPDGAPQCSRSAPTHGEPACHRLIWRPQPDERPHASADPRSMAAGSTNEGLRGTS